MNRQALQDDEEHVDGAMADKKDATGNDGALKPGRREDAAEQDEDGDFGGYLNKDVEDLSCVEELRGSS